MNLLKNPQKNRNGDNPHFDFVGIPFPSTDVEAVKRLLGLCPKAAATPLEQSPGIAEQAQVESVWVKDERTRMNLGSFKALGAAYVIATHAQSTESPDLETALMGQTYVTASAGNHGLSVAAGAKVFGAQAVIYIAETVPESFAQRLRDLGAEVRREGDNYEASMAAALGAADENKWFLLSDSSWDGYTEAPHKLMEGYLVLMDEAAAQMTVPPTHIFLQAGVGGLAGAMAAISRKIWGDAPKIIVVEPAAAPAIFDSIRVGEFVSTTGPESCMGRLDCKEASLIALKGLSRDADFFVTLSEAEALESMPVLKEAGLATSPSGGAGLAALLKSAPHRAAFGLTPDSRVLTILSEGPAD